MQNKYLFLYFYIFISCLITSQEAHAFRFGPRLGIYNEKIENNCLNSRQIGLQLGLLFEKSPDKTCSSGDCENYEQDYEEEISYENSSSEGCTCNCNGNGSNAGQIMPQNYYYPPAPQIAQPMPVPTPPKPAVQQQIYFLVMPDLPQMQASQNNSPVRGLW